MELNELLLDKNQEPQWRETARWIKFEEDVEEETERWGKPHVASLSFRSLLELRRTLAHGSLPCPPPRPPLPQEIPFTPACSPRTTRPPHFLEQHNVWCHQRPEGASSCDVGSLPFLGLACPWVTAGGA